LRKAETLQRNPGSAALALPPAKDFSQPAGCGNQRRRSDANATYQIIEARAPFVNYFFKFYLNFSLIFRIP
jgi:hypothetical protein